jgi:hypothetical protein
MKRIYSRYGKIPKEPYLDEKELSTNLGNGNFIFVGSSCDMWASRISIGFITRILEKTFNANGNKYLFQTKNPIRFNNFLKYIRKHDVLATTIESNRYYPEIDIETPIVEERLAGIWHFENTMITIEPIMDFDLLPSIKQIKFCKPFQVNIGADTGNNHLPEPSKEKIRELIHELEKFTTVYQKKNLRRLINAE